ncbi:hypothetical protein K502DRAFT_345115 [Neoconidiobolus thromboides FSU 785]|nr:hypothetical protein K502DRAFT_345115 [Neoconidiobolus thromboides FSU 785]
MSNNEWPDFKLPEAPTAKLILVSNISPVTDEKVVKDFFLFCGKIEQFLIIPAEDNESNKALILFEKESAAKTALMLTNASIGERNILVEPYYKEDFPTPKVSEIQRAQNANSTTASSEQTAQGGNSFFNSIINTGIQLSQKVIQTGKEIDTQYGVSTQVKSYIERAKEETKKLDEKYHVSERATELDKKLGVTSTINTAAATVSSLSHQALETEQGKKVSGFVQTAVRSVEGVRDEALKALNIPVNHNTQPSTSTTSESNTYHANILPNNDYTPIPEDLKEKDIKMDVKEEVKDVKEKPKEDEIKDNTQSSSKPE